MADNADFKLLKCIDPSKVNVQINNKFAKLTLSSTKKTPLAEEHRTTTKTPQENVRTSVSRNLMNDLSDEENQNSPKTNMSTYENPLLRSHSSSIDMGNNKEIEETQLNISMDQSENMEPLQFSALEFGTQPKSSDVDIELLSQVVSNLTMQEQQQQMPQTNERRQQQQQPQPQQSICISSDDEAQAEEDEEEDSSASCITISDTASSEKNVAAATTSGRKANESPNISVVVSEQQKTVVEPTGDQQILSSGKMARIEAFLRDVSFEMQHRKENDKRESLEPTLDDVNKTIAMADTESMSMISDNWSFAHRRSSVNNQQQQQQEGGGGGVVKVASTIQRDDSKRLADNDTEVDTFCSNDLDDDVDKTIDETPPPPPVHCNDDADLEDSVNIPETSSEAETEEKTPIKGTESITNSSPASSGDGNDNVNVNDNDNATIQVSSINISAKINIKIHIPIVHSTTSNESDDDDDDDNHAEPEPAPELESSPPIEKPTDNQQQHKIDVNQHRSVLIASSSDSDADTDSEQFLSNAEKLLNQLYGKSWQTPDVIRTLKRSSGSGGGGGGAAVAAAGGNDCQATPLSRYPKTNPRKAATTAKKTTTTTTRKKIVQNESMLSDFKTFKTAVQNRKLNSTQMALAPPKTTSLPRPFSKHIHADRLQKLVDSDSEDDRNYKDDDDADATDPNSSDLSDQSIGDGGDGGGGGDDDDGHNVTYLDLTQKTVQVVNNGNVGELKRLDDILASCGAITKPKLPATPINSNTEKSRRQLFTPNVGYEDDSTVERIVQQAVDLEMLDYLENIHLPGTPVHKRLQQVRRENGIETPKGKPIFKPHQVQVQVTPKTAPPKTTTTTTTTTTVRKALTQKNDLRAANDEKLANRKCSFMKSLDGNIKREYCDPDAYFYRENFAKQKEQLAFKIYDMFNEKVCGNKLVVKITWTKLLRNTAGRCKTKRGGDVSSIIELSLKVLTSADRLRCTLIHELCHAAAWIFDGHHGHGKVWRSWADRTMRQFPDLPPIQVCHNYAIEFKYTYKCTFCDISCNAHSKSKKVENLRCKVCRGPIVVLLNKKDKQGNVITVPVREPTGFAKFVKENYDKFKRDNLKAPEVLALLGAEYAKQKSQEKT